MKPFIVLAPVYDHKSAGVRVMHMLCNELNRGGHEAYLLFYGFPASGGIVFYSRGDTMEGLSPEHDQIKKLPASSNPEDFRALINSACVIYPEVIQGNPLSAPNVVRYILNKPSSNGYPMNHGAEDFLLSFSRNYWENPDHLLTILVDEPFFNDQGTLPAEQRRMDCTYVGKGSDFGHCFKVPDTVMLERRWPADKESLAIMLKNTRYLFTWDLVTQTNTDAVRCGAIPVVIRWQPFTTEILDLEYGQLPYAELVMENGNAMVVYDREIYRKKREKLLATYRNMAETCTLRVTEAAQLMQDFFARPAGQRRD